MKDEHRTDSVCIGLRAVFQHPRLVWEIHRRFLIEHSDQFDVLDQVLRELLSNSNTLAFLSV